MNEYKLVYRTASNWHSPEDLGERGYYEDDWTKDYNFTAEDDQKAAKHASVELLKYDDVKSYTLYKAIPIEQELQKQKSMIQDAFERSEYERLKRKYSKDKDEDWKGDPA